MPATDVASVLWVDSFGNPGATRFHVLTTTTDAHIVAVADAMQGVSDLKAEVAQRTSTVDFDGVEANPLDADHPYADDRAALLLSFEVPTTSQHVFISIPGPKIGVGPGDDMRIDPSNAVFDDLKTAVAACVTTQLGDASGSLQRGAINISRAPRAH